jgi:hypothetical protein
MYSRKFGVHGMISAAVAFAILGAGALVLDGAHLFSAPIGVVKVGPPSPVEPLEEIVVSVNR